METPAMHQAVSRFARRSRGRRHSQLTRIQQAEVLEERTLLAGNSIADSGGFEGSQMTLPLDRNGGGYLEYSYEHFVIPDNFIIRYEGKNLLQTGFVGGNRSGQVSIPKGNSDFVTVIVATNDEGTAWNYSVTEFGCGDTGPLVVELASGEFEDTDGDGTCEGTGTVYVGLKNGINKLIRVENAKVEYDKTNLWIDEGTVFAAVGNNTTTPLFASDLSFAFNAPSSVVDEETIGNDLDLGGLPTEFERIALRPDGISLDGEFALPETALFTGLGLENRTVEMKGKNALFVGAKGTGFGSDVGTTDFPTSALWKLYNFIGLTNFGAKISYDGAANELKIQGKFKVTDLAFVETAADLFNPDPGASATLDLSDDRLSGRENAIKIKDGVADISGVVKIENIPLPAGFRIAEISIEFDTQNGALNDVGGKVKFDLPLKGKLPLPPDPALTFEGGFKKVGDEWHLDDAVGDFDIFSVPVPGTPLILVSVKGGLKNLAPDNVPTSFIGGLGLTGGPSVKLDVPAWLPFNDLEASLFRIDGDLESNGRFFTGTTKVSFLTDNVLEINGRMTLDLDKKIFEIPAQLKGLGGLLEGNGDLKFDWGKGHAYLFANVQGKLPDSRLLFSYRGKTLAGASALLKASFDGNLGNDSVALWGEIDIPTPWRTTPSFKKTVGIQLFADSEWRILGDNNIPPVGSWDVPNGQEYLLMSADWENEQAGDVAVRVIDNNGNVIEEADFAANNIAVVPDMTSGYAKTVVVGTPDAGIWDLEVVDESGLGDVQYRAEVDTDTPAIDVLTPNGNQTGGMVDINFNAFDADSQAQVTLFYDDNSEGFNGTPIVFDLTEEDGSGSYTWDTKGLAPGEYSIYAMIEDDTNAPVMAYAPGTVTISETTDLAIKQVPSVNAGVVNQNVTYTIDVDNLGGSVAGDTIVTFEISNGTIDSTSITPTSQTDTVATFSLGDIAASGTEQFEITVNAPADPGTIESLLTVGSSTYEADPTNNESTFVLIVDETPVLTPDLTIELTSAPDAAELGEDYTYELRISNVGTGPATDVSMTEALPQQTSFVGVDNPLFNYNSTTHSVTSNSGTLAPGESVTVMVTVNPFAAGDLYSVTTVTSAEGDASQADNFLITTNTIEAIDPPPADLDLMVVTDNEQPSLGDVFNIIVTVNNAGPGVASGIMIQNMIPPQLQVNSWSTPQGTYDTTTGMWDVGNVRDDLSRALTLTTEVVSGGSGSFTAEIVGVNEDDPDSAPDNGAGEDDYVAIDIQTGLSCDAEGSGNVRVSMNSRGDVRIRGSRHSNAIAIVEDGGDIIVTGLGNTRINGSRDAYVIAEGTTRVSGDVLIRMRGGDDTVCAQSVHFREDLDVYGGGGDDTFAASEVRVGDDFMAHFGAGHDQFAVDGFDVDGKTTIDFGLGHDIAVGRNVDLDDTVHIFGRAGRDLFAIQDIDMGENSYIRMGGGRDTVAMLGTNRLGGRARVRGGGGRDSYEFSGSTSASKKPRITSFRNDSIDNFDDHIESALDRLMESGINVGNLLD